MCGRFLLTSSPDQLALTFGFANRPNLAARYNIAPTQDIAIVRPAAEGDDRELVLAHWGLIPFWAKDAKIAYKTFNARAEGIAGKPSFREAFRRRRCLIPADGFYEWQKLNGGKVKQPFLIQRRSKEPFAFAGLWERWNGPEGEVQSATIITTEANARMAVLHNRQPVILDPADHERWLDPGQPDAETLLRPCPDDWLELRPVSQRLNSTRNQGPDLLQADLNPA